MADNLTIQGWEDDEYRAFVDKFKAKKTTDDCYTPPNIYAAVSGYVSRRYGLAQEHFVRPFRQGGDYQAERYAPEDVVVDNPPFSILAEILRFYLGRGIRFFLFAPTLTLFSAPSAGCTALPCGVTVTYDNGAEVNTSFLTNLDPPELRVRTDPELYRLIDEANKENERQLHKSLPKFVYPDFILTSAMAARWCRYGVAYELRTDESLRIPALDAQRASGTSIFGSGYLLSTSAAAEKAAAEKAAAKVWDLSETERAMVAYLDARAPRKEP